MPQPDEDLKTQAGFDAFTARHGGLVGTSKMSPDTEGGKLTGAIVQNPVYHYEFGDGSTLDASSLGLPGLEVKSITEKQAKATPEQLQQVTDPRTGEVIALTGPGTTINLPKLPAGYSGAFWRKNSDGTETRMATNAASGNIEEVPGPDGNPITQPGAAGTAPPGWKNTDWVEKPDGTKELYGFDPSGNYAKVPGAPTQAGTPKKPTAPTFIEVKGNKYPVIPDDSAQGYHLGDPVAGGASHDSGYFVENGYKVYKNYNEGTGQYEVDPTIPPEAWSPAAKATEAKTASQPKEGDTRTNIEGGYNVTQTYKGGDWTTTSIGNRAQPMTPATLQAPTDQPFIVRTDETGQPQTIANPNYQPKAATSRAEIAQRAANLQQQATAMRDKIAQDVTVPADQKAQRFNDWWAQNIAPQKQALEAGYADVARAEAQDQAKQQREALTTAQTTGQNVVEAYAKTLPYRVGPNFDKVMGQLSQAWATGKMPGNLDMTGAFTYQLPDTQQMYQDAVAQTLKSISPQAAAMTGNAPPSFDLNNMLNMGAYNFGGPPAPTA